VSHWGWVVRNDIKAIFKPEIDSVHKPIMVASGHSLGHQEWGDPIRVASENAESQEGVIVMPHIA
jgi:hypothetical protein